jgi:hypothetical protein
MQQFFFVKDKDTLQFGKMSHAALWPWYVGQIRYCNEFYLAWRLIGQHLVSGTFTRTEAIR